MKHRMNWDGVDFFSVHKYIYVLFIKRVNISTVNDAENKLVRFWNTPANSMRMAIQRDKGERDVDRTLA